MNEVDDAVVRGGGRGRENGEEGVDTCSSCVCRSTRSCCSCSCCLDTKSNPTNCHVYCRNLLSNEKQRASEIE